MKYQEVILGKNESVVVYTPQGIVVVQYAKVDESALTIVSVQPNDKSQIKTQKEGYISLRSAY